jgi:asparagine synthase (glutamine-hydrolysing)
MTRSIGHRGPDGEYIYNDGPIWLGNRRLAIQDVAAGQQPMSNADGSVVVVYNGEIYNYPELRKELLDSGCPLQTHCDTEVLPYLYEKEGISFVERLNGIFAFALWDRRTAALYLVRDPIGVKPLLFTEKNGRVAFGSEAKCIVASGLIGPEIDPISLNYSMNVRYIPGDGTFFSGIKRLSPGSYMRVSSSGIAKKHYTHIDRTPDTHRSEDEWIESIVGGLEDAVNRQLLSDVPVGVTLSGGIDSSAIVAMIRRRTSAPIKTFSLGFNEPTDENDDARIVAKHFETEHHDLVLKQPSLHRLRDAIEFVEEPKVNCLQLFMLHEYIGQHVKVNLSGLGGDELFAGYDFYDYLSRSTKVGRVMPKFLMNYVFAPPLNAAASALTGLARPEFDLAARGLHWIAALKDPTRHYLLLRNAWDENDLLLRRIYHPDWCQSVIKQTRLQYEQYFDELHSVRQGSVNAEFETKMVNDLLHNEDTMSMAHSVESRVPMLDIEFVRLIARIPEKLLFSLGKKGLLKKSLENTLPKSVLTKKKWGFSVDPVEQFKKDLKPMAAELLNDSRVRNRGIFNPKFVHDVINSRPQGRLRWHYFMLWQMIGIEMWCDRFLKSP